MKSRRAIFGSVRSPGSSPGVSSDFLPGFSMVELVVAIGMFSLIAISIQSAVLLTSRAIPDAKGPNANQLSASAVADRIASELTYAMSVTEMTATAITFTVADRNGDGTPETIRYAWSGVSGDPLTRQYNAGSPATVLPDVRECSLAYDKQSQKSATTYTESAESLLYSFNGSFSSGDLDIDKNDWYGQYFVPNLPNNAFSWRITHVRFRAEANGPKIGEFRVQVRRATSNGLPTNTLLDQADVLESSLGSNYSWQDVYFTSASGLSPSSGACIVFRWVSDADACDIQYYYSVLPNGMKLLYTSNSGSTWSLDSYDSIPLYVYGTSSTQNADTYQYSLNSVRLTLRSGADVGARVNSSARVLSQPQVAGP